MNLVEMQEKRGRLVTQAREALDEIKSNTDESRAAELGQRHDNIMADFDKVEADIAREQRVAAAEARIAEAAEEEARSKRPNGDSQETPAGDQGDEISYRRSFHDYLIAGGREELMAPESRAVLMQGFQKIEGEEQRAQTTAVAAGGYTIPEEMVPQLVVSMQKHGPMYNPAITTEFVTDGGNAMPFPTVDDTGVDAEAHTEGATLTDDGGKDVTFGEKTLNAYAFNTEWLRVSRELADDSAFPMETVLNRLLGKRLGKIANVQLTTGTGSNAPNGIVTASALGKTAAGAAAITYDEILDLEHSVDPEYREGESVGYMFNDTPGSSTLLAVRKLKDGDGNYLWQAGNVQAGIPQTINGNRFFINNAMSSLATGQKVMLFGDMSAYFVRKVGQPLIGAIQDKDFWPGFGIAGYIRFDGELSDTAAVKHLITA